MPNDNSLKLAVLEDLHDSKVAGHFGRDKTYELVKRNWWWPGLDDFIRKYVSSCDSCQQNKTKRRKAFGKLLLLELPYTLWTHISIDFIVDLPKVKSYILIFFILMVFHAI